MVFFFKINGNTKTLRVLLTQFTVPLTPKAVSQMQLRITNILGTFFDTVLQS